jgi:hypothetical protein
MRLRTFTTSCLLAVLVGCHAESSPIFDWNELRGVAGAAGRHSAGVAGAAGSGSAGQGANSAGMGMPVESGVGGSVAPRVHFDWTETSSSRGMCSGAVFVGGFSCTVQNSLPTRIDGTIVLDLVGPSEAQILDAANGTVTLLVDPSGMTAINTKVTGKLACMNRSFTGEIPETMFTPDQTGVLFQVFSGLLCASGNTAKGTLDGKLDSDALSLAGNVMLMIGTCSCAGTFDLRAQR